MKQSMDSNYLIPTGSDLRVLLNSEHISYGEILSVLKGKGIFPSGVEKSVTVPLLASTLMKPSEYAGLIDAAVDRDSKPKMKVSSLRLTDADVDWVQPLKSLFVQGFDPCGNIESIDVIDAPNIVVEAKDRVRIPYKINRRDFSKDWMERELEFEGEVVIERQGLSLKLDFTSTHSSKETEKINRRLTSQISAALKQASVTADEREERITFDCFSNVERVRFFKRLTGGLGSHVGRGSVNDMEISRDASAPPLPNDPQVEWMNHTVKRVKIDGEKLNDIFLIADEKYFPFYHVQRMDVTYAFSLGANSGSFRAGFFFSATSEVAKSDAELTFEVLRIAHDDKTNSDSRKSIAGTIALHLRSMIETEYSRVVAERAEGEAA